MTFEAAHGERIEFTLYGRHFAVTMTSMEEAVIPAIPSSKNLRPQEDGILIGA